MNPYEVRLEVLKMAQGILERQFDTEQAFLWELMSKNGLTLETLRSAMPQMPTPEQIKEKANELYEFVSQNK
jgi:methanogenic corrinoid protein MtbC1